MFTQILPQGLGVLALPLLHNSHVSLELVTPFLEEGNSMQRQEEFS